MEEMEVFYNGERGNKNLKGKWVKGNILENITSSKILRNCFADIRNICYGEAIHIAELDVDFMWRFVERGAATEPLLTVDLEISLAVKLLVFIPFTPPIIPKQN